MEAVTTPWASENSQSITDLLVGFFDYFGNQFDWSQDAVCPRLNQQTGVPIRKLSLMNKAFLSRKEASKWYIEDPFEFNSFTRHSSFNNATSTSWGQKQIL